MKKLFPYIVSFLLIFPVLSYGQEDIFRVKTPNAMIIFDTSGSMEMSVNVDKYGNSIWTNKYGPDKVTQYRKDGNHPDSRLYQAKKAMSEIIDQVVKDKVNLGFSTYAQTQIVRSRGLYKRDEEVIDQAAVTEGWRRWKRYYAWDTTNDGTYYPTSIYPDSFVDAWGITWSNVTAHASTGTEFTRAISIHDKSGPLHPKWIGGNSFQTNKAYTITYRVTARTLNAETNVYTFTYTTISPAFDRYRENYFDDGWSGVSKDCGLDKKGNPWASKISSGVWWYTYFSDDSPPTEYNTPSGSRTANWWNCSVEYRAPKSKISHTETKYYWLDTSAATCALTIAGTPVYNLVPGTCFDWSYFRYNPQTDIKGDKPHTWSYYNIDKFGKWKKSQQPDPFYPALTGNPGENDNHHFFVNFPDDKDALFKDSDRTTIKNTIMSFLDLTPVKRPDAAEYWTKLPIHSIAGKMGLSGNGDAFDSKKQTPLADSLAWSFTYFDDYINKYKGGDPSSNEKFGETLCRGNYIILLTDGLESCRYDKDGNPDYTAAVTEAANLYGINVKTFVIGFGSDVIGNKNLNNIALAGSGGKYKAYEAADFDQLKEALRSIFQIISGQYYGRSNPVITKTGDRIFKGFFEFTPDNSWKGGLYAYDIDKSTGNIKLPQAWDAGEKLTNQGRGTVWTWKDDLPNLSRQSFDIGTSALYPLVYPNPLTEDIDGDGSTDNDDAKTIIGYTLDPNVDDRPGGGIHPPPYHKGQRPVIGNQGWKLGDIYHSTPVFVAAPPFGFAENDYSIFYQEYKDRTQMVYVGANDGMLHGIKNTKGTTSTDGREHIAIIPKNLLGKVRNLRSTHDYYVDATPKAYDVFFSKLTTDKWKKWRTVIITGQRDGGPYYFAVDVTNPDGKTDEPEYPRILWEWTDPNMGNSWAKPDVGKIKVKEGDKEVIKFVAFITGGYSTDKDKGNSFYIVDIETGITMNPKPWVKLGSKDNKIPSGPTAFDTNGDGLIDFVYFGDTDGKLWKVNVTSANKNDWSCDPLFTPPSGQRKPIFYSPTVVKNNEGKILVFFGTGEEMNLLTVNTPNYFWEVWDNNGKGEIIGSKWPKVLLTGEKVLSSPVVANYVVYFTSWLYTAGSDYCGAGSGKLYGFKISNAGVEGGLAGLVLLDSDNKPKPVTEFFDELGPGIPTSPVVTNGNIYVSSSVNAKDIIRIRFLGWPAATTRSWREVF